MSFDTNAVMTNLVSTGTQVGLKLLGALAIWIIGRMVINFTLRLLSGTLQRQHFDTTVASYVTTSASVAMRLALLLAVLSFCGVETSSFAALLAAAGVAIGMAWSGLLSNFAAGIFLVILRPFKVGDFVTAGGITGTVKAIGLFGTNIDTPDGVMTVVGNGKIFADTIQNYSHNAYRRVDLVAQLPHGVDPQAAARLLKEGMRRISNVNTSPEPECGILSFSPAGPLLAVRPYTSNDSYWQVYFDTNQMIVRTFAAAGYPVPAEQYLMFSETGSFPTTGRPDDLSFLSRGRDIPSRRKVADRGPDGAPTSSPASGPR